MLRTAVLVVATTTILASSAAAQVCHEVSSGVAQIDVTTTATTIKMVGAIPKANSVSCGFPATMIIVIGRDANDTVTLNYVPPSVLVSLQLKLGTDSLVVDGNGTDETITVAATGIDRNNDGSLDLFFGDTTPAKLTIEGKAGNDSIDASASPVKTTLNGGDGDDSIFGSNFNDVIDGGTGGDLLYGNGGNDSITGGLGDDVMMGGPGNDTFVATKIAVGGSDGHDLIVGDTGTDVASYTKRTTPVIAGFGGDTSVAEDQIIDDVETIKGGSGADHFDFGSSIPAYPHNLYGGAGNDILVGSGGNDKLFGEAGNDILNGGGGADTMDGGDGNDLFLPSTDTAVDALKCGTGRDWYTKGAEDTINACEHAVERKLRIATGAWHTCAILADGRLKCWGDNQYGELGLGDTDNRGDASGEMGNTLPAVDLGGVAPNAFKAVAVATGNSHTCALLDTGDVKCWGFGGAIGEGDSSGRGWGPGQMGNALAPVALGTGRHAVAITAGYYTSCALLDNAQVKCWGSGLYGATGHGDTATLGDEPGEMGDALPPIDLGTGRTAIAIASVGYHTCATLDDGRVKCWGNGADGQLGNGSTGDVGDQPGEMGDALAPIDLGTNRLAITVTTGAFGGNSCAVLDDGTVKCWGQNDWGQLGIGDTSDRGNLPGQMGDALPTVALGTGRTATAVSAGTSVSCAVLDDRSVKCWGRDAFGALGQGYSMDRGGWAGSMGDALAPIDLGTGRTATAVAYGGTAYGCAALDNHLLKCWGRGLQGSLGLGALVMLGDQPGEMGDALPYVDLGANVAFAPTADGLADPDDPGDSATATADALDDGTTTDDTIADDDATAVDGATGDDATEDDDVAVGCSAAGSGGPALPIALVAIGLVLGRRCRRRRH